MIPLFRWCLSGFWPGRVFLWHTHSQVVCLHCAEMANISHKQRSVTEWGQAWRDQRKGCQVWLLFMPTEGKSMAFFWAFLLLVFANVHKPECRHEQHVNLKFLCKAGYKPVECWRHLRQVFGAETMSQTQVRVWHNRFHSGEESTADRPKSGHPQSVWTKPNTQLIQNLVTANNQRSIRGLSTASGLSHGTVWNIVKKDLHMRWRSAWFVPHLLTQEQKAFRQRLCQENLNLMRAAPAEFLGKIMTTDETWIATFEPETKRQSSAWILPDEGMLQKARRQRGQQKTMMTVFFDFQGMIHMEFMPQGGTIKSEEYCETLGQFKEAVCSKRPELWVRNNEGYRSFLLHQDNAPCHVAVPTLAKFGEWGIELLAHPSYSPDLAPCDFALFPKLKQDLCGRRFANLKLLKNEAKCLLRSYPDDFYEQVFADLVTRWKKCIAMEGGYFEGTHVSVPPEVVEEGQTSSDSSEDDWKSACCLPHWVVIFRSPNMAVMSHFIVVLLQLFILIVGILGAHYVGMMFLCLALKLAFLSQLPSSTYQRKSGIIIDRPRICRRTGYPGLFHRTAHVVSSGRVKWSTLWSTFPNPFRFHRGQPVFYESKDAGKISATITAVGMQEIWLRRLSDNGKVRVHLSQLQKGKYILRRRSS